MLRLDDDFGRACRNPRTDNVTWLEQMANLKYRTYAWERELTKIQDLIVESWRLIQLHALF